MQSAQQAACDHRPADQCTERCPCESQPSPSRGASVKAGTATAGYEPDDTISSRGYDGDALIVCNDRLIELPKKTPPEEGEEETWKRCEVDGRYCVDVNR